MHRESMRGIVARCPLERSEITTTSSKTSGAYNLLETRTILFAYYLQQELTTHICKKPTTLATNLCKE